MIKRRAFVVGGLLAPLSCGPKGGATNVPDGASTETLSVTKLDCQSCGDRIVAALSKSSGVFAAEFDMHAVEVTVHYDNALTTPQALVAVIEQLGYGATPGAGAGAYLPNMSFPGPLDVQEIATGGNSAKLQPHLAAGKVTVFDFYAVWCGPCREVDKHMLAVLEANPDVALRKLDVVDWDSDVAKEHLSGVANLPYVIVYGKDGKKVDTISGLDLAALDAAIDKGRT